MDLTTILIGALGVAAIIAAVLFIFILRSSGRPERTDVKITENDEMKKARENIIRG
ncbi:MAG: hypothetical protein WDZ88_02390 [Candidatus Paceibacterota bacterium]